MDIESLEGSSFGPYRMRVCVEKVVEFVAASGTEGDRWQNAAPPAYLAAALFVVAPELLSKLGGFAVIHGEQTFRWDAPLQMEQDLTVTGTVTRIRERGTASFVSFELTVAAGGDVVAGGTSLFLVSPMNAEESSAPPAPTTGVDDTGSPARGQCSASRSDLVRYAAATRDWNPIHWDHGVALAAGLDGVVVHGLLQAAWALDAAGRDTPGDRPFRSARIRFRSPLRPATPVSVVVSKSEGRISVELASSETQFLSAQVETVEA